MDNNQTQEESKQKKSKLVELISTHPIGVIYAFIGTTVGIIGFFLVFFPWLTASKPELNYCVYPARSQVVQSGKTSDLSVNYKGNLIKGDLTIARIAIWNKGHSPIEKDSILAPISILTTSNAPILDIKAVHITRKEITQCSWQTNFPAFECKLNWKILEHNDGMVLQIAYAGTTNEPIILKGTIIGQNVPYKIELRKQLSLNIFYFNIIAGVLILILIIILKLKMKKVDFIDKFSILFVIIILISTLVDRLDVSPFGF
jgi:hypothetical protein